MAEPIEQAPEWVRRVAARTAEERAAMRAEARAETAKWKRGERSRVMTCEELIAWLDARGDAEEDC